MTTEIQTIIKQATQAHDTYKIETIQNLWSGYGKIERYGLKGTHTKRIIVKHVRLPKNSIHPRGWDTNLSHERKVQSYKIETNWYQTFAQRCDDACRVPHCLAIDFVGDEVVMLLEDLDAAGFPIRKQSLSTQEFNACLKWLANFHATFLHERPKGLWPMGTYWHLDTRPDELEQLEDKQLKEAATIIDSKLNNAKYLTFVHGDAKVANFCFPENDGPVAAVDFQYVGGGCGMKDVAYFVGSCMYEDECEQYESTILETYFTELKQSIKQKQLTVDVDALEDEWRKLYPIAWTDFHRFLKGWSPDHWKINSYSERISRQVISTLLERP